MTFHPERFLILLVDDVQDNLDMTSLMLEQAGYSTIKAISGQQALEQAYSNSPDLILLDLMMPEMNGLEACEVLKTDTQTSDIPVIFVTASNEHEHLLQAFNLGAVDYITKPFDHFELLLRIKTHLELKQVRDQLKQALAEVEKVAATDELTGIANRRYLLELAAKEFERAKRYRRSLALVMIDIDHFKMVNDNYGHQVGDLVLQKMASAAVTTLRRGDTLGRFGGEEFIALLPETALPEAQEVAERLRQTIANLAIAVSSKHSLQITVSLGLSIYLPADATLDAIITRADAALYVAKAEGRNQVVSLTGNEIAR
ncbi:MAG: diguanylate cyclase [Leptolyngbyaceae cyanobacterium SL_1_1]|nr:diguanylate cyclase [Leptolyngbyaceae cyanobacterium RM1_1_2]NJO11166.1 diguanylate cyclase [Leptolyngbyaceae cyanobacterium SL_1_1]